MADVNDNYGRDVIKHILEQQTTMQRIEDGELEAVEKGKVAALTAERNALRAEVEALKGTVAAYADHRQGCKVFDPSKAGQPPKECDCGFISVRHALGIDRPQPGQGEGGEASEG